MKFIKFVALGAAALLTCASATAQNIATLPNAATLTGSEKMTAAQGAGCPTKVQPCAIVAVNPAQIGTYLTSKVLGAAATQAYQEGNFTPTLLVAGSETGITYTTRKARFTRIGRVVHVQINIILSSKGPGAGILTLGGLPFPASADYVGIGGPTILDSVGSTVNGIISINAGLSTANILQYSGGSLSQLTAADIMNNTQIYYNATYEVQ